MQDRIGQQFGNYRLTKRIGRGGFAEVYQAEHIDLRNLHRAVKIMTGTSLSRDEQEKFKYEANILANLQKLNEHIVEIYDYGIQFSDHDGEEGVPYLVMEYATEGTLRRLYPHGTRVPLDRIVFYTKQVADALQCAHDYKPTIVHRDVKPENMLLRNPNHVLLSDFGIAMTGQTGLLTTTKESNILGTAAYIAPEQLSGHTHRASDQYSLGIVVYEWLCGSRPFDGTNQEILAMKLKMDPPRLYPQIPREVEDVVMHALQRKPDDRYPKVQAFAQALEEAVEASQRQSQFVRPPVKNTSRPGGFQIAPAIPEPESDIAMQAASPLEEPPKVSPLPGLEIQPSLSAMREEPREVQPPLLAMREDLPVAPLLLPLARPAAPMYEVDREVGATWHYENLDDTEAMTPRRPIPSAPSPAPTFTQELKSMFIFFELSSQFARDSRTSLFRNLGIVANMVAAVALTVLMLMLSYSLLESIGAGVAALFISWGLFSLCIRVVEPVLALFFGALVALYWGLVGLLLGQVLGNHLAAGLPINSQLPILVGLIFLCASLGLHIWYVIRKLP